MILNKIQDEIVYTQAELNTIFSELNIRFIEWQNDSSAMYDLINYEVIPLLNTIKSSAMCIWFASAISDNITNKQIEWKIYEHFLVVVWNISRNNNKSINIWVAQIWWYVWWILAQWVIKSNTI